MKRSRGWVLYTRPSPPTSLLSPSQLSPDEGPAAAALGEFLRKWSPLCSVWFGYLQWVMKNEMSFWTPILSHWLPSDCAGYCGGSRLRGSRRPRRLRAQQPWDRDGLHCEGGHGRMQKLPLPLPTYKCAFMAPTKMKMYRYTQSLPTSASKVTSSSGILLPMPLLQMWEGPCPLQGSWSQRRWIRLVDCKSKTPLIYGHMMMTTNNFFVN